MGSSATARSQPSLERMSSLWAQSRTRWDSTAARSWRSAAIAALMAVSVTMSPRTCSAGSWAGELNRHGVHPGRVAPKVTRYSQPWASAVRSASTRLRAAVLAIAEDR